MLCNFKLVKHLHAHTTAVLQSIASLVSDSTSVKATFSQTPKLKTGYNYIYTCSYLCVCSSCSNLFVFILLVSPHQTIPLALVVVPCILLVVAVTVLLFCSLCCLQKGITAAKYIKGRINV